MTVLGRVILSAAKDLPRLREINGQKLLDNSQDLGYY